MIFPRYKSRKVERARDLFEEAIRACSESESMMMRLHVLYGKLEERYGLARKALQIYQQGVEKITKDKVEISTSKCSDSLMSSGLVLRISGRS